MLVGVGSLKFLLLLLFQNCRQKRVSWVFCFFPSSAPCLMTSLDNLIYSRKIYSIYKLCVLVQKAVSHSPSCLCASDAAAEEIKSC